MAKLLLPQKLEAVLLSDEPRSHRDAAMLDLAVLNGYRASEIAAVNRADINLKKRLIQRHRGDRVYWQPLLATHWTGWKMLIAAAPDSDSPLFVSVRGIRLSRVDVWRVLRGIGRNEKLRKPLHTRWLRHVLGSTLSNRHCQPAETTAAALGLAHLNGVQGYHRKPKWDKYPTSQSSGDDDLTI